MSNTITATVHSDPELSSIRSMVAGKNDGIPFLLLPVKIETRFMTVDAPVYGGDTLPWLIEDLYVVVDDLIFDPGIFTRDEVLRRLGEITARLEAVVTKAGDVKRLNGEDKTLLSQKAQALVSGANSLNDKLGRLKWTNQEDLAQMRNYRTELTRLAPIAASSINKLSPISGASDGLTADFITGLQSVHATIDSLGSQNFSTRDWKEKRTVFAATESYFSTLEQGIISVRKQMDASMTAAPSEVKAIKKLVDTLDDSLEKSARGFEKLQSKYKKTEYQSVTAVFQAALKNLKNELDTRLMPRLQLKTELRTVDARRLMVQVNETWFWLRKINAQAFKNYQDVKSTRVLLYAKLLGLRSQIHKVLEGDEEDFAALRSAWDSTDKELERFIQRVVRVKPENSSEKAGLSRTVTHLNKEYRRDLGSLRTGVKSSFPELTNQALAQSDTVYKKALEEISQLNQSIQRNLLDTGDEAQAKTAAAQLTALNRKLTMDFRNLHILPEAKLSQIKAASADLAKNVEAAFSTGRVDGTAFSPEIKAASEKGLAGIVASVNAQVSDAVGIRDRFYDEIRPGIVFAPKTMTQKELWVRIYPDDIAVHTHEEALTQAEVDAGKAYWYEIWAAGDDADLKLAAWRAISTSYGSQRAAWIVKKLEPTEVEESISAAFTAVSADIILANSTLSSANALLKRGIDMKEDAFKTLGEVFPYMTSAATQLEKIRKANETLLLKSRRILLKTQSLLGKYLATIGRLNADQLEVIGTRIETATLVKDNFTRAVDAFKTIRPEKTAVSLSNEVLAPVFPTVTIKDGSWTEAPHSRVMPEQFVVVAVRGGQYRYVEVGRPLPANRLVVGLDPDSFSSETFTYDEDGNLIVDESIKWLTDFKTARDIGMAISFKIDQSDWDEGFDKLIVLGVKNSSANAGKNLLQALIDNHHYIPEGASFLPVGTPTNNTESGQSGYRSFEEDAAISFEIERRSESGVADTSDPDYPVDYERLADALGISRATLQHFDYSKETEVSDALLMNKALFPGTLKGYMEDGMDTIFTQDNINRTEIFFNKYVSARGYLPSFRIGTQPYGILPTTAFSYFECTSNDAVLPQLSETDFENPASIESDLQIRFDIRLKNLLRFANGLFTTIRESKVKYSGNTDAANPQGHFMEMLGLNASSVERYYRYGLNVAARQGASEAGGFSIGFDSTNAYGPVNTGNTFRDLIVPGYYFQSDSFTDETATYSSPALKLDAQYSRIATQFQNMRIFAMRHLQEQEQLLGETIDHRELSDTVQPVTALTGVPEEDFVTYSELEHYVDWITTQNPWDVHTSNVYSTLEEGEITPGMPAKSLLFQLLRHSMMSAYADTMLDILEYEGLIDQKIRRKMGQARYYYSRYDRSFNYVTKWTFLFSRVASLQYVLGGEMDTANAFYVHMNTRDTHDRYLNRYISPEHTYIYTDFSGHANHDPFMEHLQSTRAAIQKLKEIPTASLDKLLAEHLDLCAYRLDAWYLGLANKRLEEQRGAHPTGIYLGAYGYVEKLTRGGALELAEDLPSGLWKNGDAPIYKDDDSLGFIHTPSLNHAITAAVLRAGFHSNAATAEVNNQMAVNLSSERVRLALNLLHGIRGGQEAGALLGYQFERGLHERYPGVELDAFIYDFRDKFPLTVPVDETVSLGTAALTNVVHGMDLLEFAQDFIENNGGPEDLGDSLYEALSDKAALFWTTLGIASLIPAGFEDEQDAILREIDRMANAFDALGDLCVSESIYQMANGNHVRASAILDQLAKGDVPAEIAIADTPRTGTVVTHKVALFLERIPTLDHELSESGPDSLPYVEAEIDAAVAAAGASPAGWNARFGPRPLLEPSLNKWVGEMIGDPAKIKCLVDYEIVDSESVATVGVITATLADLGLQPLDVLHLFGTGALIGGAELNSRIAVYARTQLPALPVGFEGTTDDVPLTLRFTERDAAWAEDEYSFYEKAGYIQALRKLVTSSGILAADHLHIPGEEEVEDDAVRNQDVDDLSIRVSNAYTRLSLVGGAFTGFFTSEIDPEEVNTHTYTEAQIDSLRSMLTDAAGFGLPASLPELAVSYGDEAGRILMTAAIGVNNGITDRLTRAATELAIGNTTTLANDPRVDALVEAARCIMGPAFRIFPQFTLRNVTEITDQLSLAPSMGLLRAAAPEAMTAWGQGMGRVRERMADLEMVEILADNFGVDMPAVNPVQLPFALNELGESADHWLGLPFPAGYAPTEDKLSVVMLNPSAVTTDSADPKVALLIDEWVEIIPNKQETTGITFHYDQPDAKAPNTLLLAVTPKVTGHWVWDDLIHTIEDTIELAKNRAVEPEHLEDTVFGQILPGILTEIVPPTASGADFEPTDNPLGMQVVTDFKINNETIPEEV